MTTVSAIFAYHKAPVSVLLFLIYSIIILSILFTDELPSIPSNLGDLDVNKAYADLHKVRMHSKVIQISVVDLNKTASR